MFGPSPLIQQQQQQQSGEQFVIIIFGASGDLVRRKTLPALYGLYMHTHTLPDVQKPAPFRIIGYARSNTSAAEILEKSESFLLKVQGATPESINSFFENFEYLAGAYDTDEGFQRLKGKVHEKENLIYYLALPPSQFSTVAQMIKRNIYNPAVQNRLVVEKPFGKDSESSRELLQAISSLFVESEVYRIDHYLGKEMVKNLMILRFGNVFFNTLWSRQCIDNVQIVFKETIGVEGRGGYFDEYGIIRDVLQNHMLQLLSLVAMDRPASLDPEDIRDEKVKVLKCIEPVQYGPEVVIGQYGPSGTHCGYAEEETVPSSSLSPTYAMLVLRVRNERWDGVPFIIRCGKGLHESKSEIRVQFRDVPGNLFPLSLRNELVLRVQPNECIYLKLITKRPGLAMDPLLTDLDLSYHQRYEDVRIPDAYESLLLDVLKGDQQNFVRADELQEAWRIVTPLLRELEQKRVAPLIYPFGSRGPPEVDALLQDVGYVRVPGTHQHEYSWPKINLSPCTSNKDMKQQQ